ncbi:MFS transporter [Neorhizobium sp. AL 9.2.2]|uniref:MFS transporter n=1 Tax=Neorhizobium sp. AL 9.2.2 TaxID=2712894 RepID=UPI001571F9A8|nr:MFS transporter [Neorhizobium sp. AL 9.2.2]NSY20161.1 MHS family MFS transporter [Neorhizobium sp. AL 9.2.2]
MWKTAVVQDEPAGTDTFLRTTSNFRIIGLVSVGGALVFYDFVVFAFLAPVIGKLFFPVSVAPWLATVQSFGIFAAGYFFRPLGGVVLAHYGDLFGRKYIFAFSIVLVSGATLGVAVLPTYSSIGIAAPLMLILLRVVQGIGIGAEVPGAWTLVAEQSSAPRMGIGCGLVSTGLSGGILLASAVVAFVTCAFSDTQMDAFAWRIPFVLGALFSIPAIFIRWQLKESPGFASLPRRHKLVPVFPLKAVLCEHRDAVVLCMLITWVISAGILITGLMTASLLQTSYGISAHHALWAASIGTLAFMFGTMISGLMIDRIGIGPSLMGGSIQFAFASYIFYSLAGFSIPILYALYAWMGFAAGIIAAAPYIMVLSFPPRVRMTGISFSYNIAYAFFGGLTPGLIAWLVKLDRMAPAYYLLFIACLAWSIGCYICRHPRILQPDLEPVR